MSTKQNIRWVPLLMTVLLAMRAWAAEPVQQTRLTVISIPRFDWVHILEQDRAGRMPTFRRLFEGNTSHGDILAMDYPGEESIAASILTGRFPFNHKLTPERMSHSSMRPAERGQRPVWDWLMEAGAPVAVIGFPRWNEMPPGSALIVAPYDGADPAGIVQRLPPGVDASNFLAAITQPGRFPETTVSELLGGESLDLELRTRLRDAVAADMTMAALMRLAHQRLPRAHVFARLDGLQRFERAAEGSLPAATVHAIVGRYHVWLGGLLGSSDVESTVEQRNLFIYSETGTPGGGMSYRPRFPKVAAAVDGGFFLATGPSLQRMPFAPLAMPEDLAITWLYVAGVPKPETLDGVILFDVINENIVLEREHVPAP